jgi:deoxyuridine 5'-triphosphate nucleotidohydrolase
MLYNTITGRKVDLINPNEYVDLYVISHINCHYTVASDYIRWDETGDKLPKQYCDYVHDEEFEFTKEITNSLYDKLADEKKSFQFFDGFKDQHLAKKFFVAANLCHCTKNSSTGFSYGGNSNEYALIESVCNIPFERASAGQILFTRRNKPDLCLYDRALEEEYAFLRTIFGDLYYLKPHWDSTPVRVKRVAEDAILPTNKRRSDTGLDVTLIKKLKTDEWGTEWYDTGLQIEPPPGYYTELVGRSSLIKKGRQLANCVGVIDETYRNNLLVCLTKLHPKAPDLELPIRACQLILRKHEVAHCEEVDTLSNTDRALGGFGSTG